MATQDGGRTLQTTQTSLEVVETLRAMDGARVTELAEEMGVAPSTMHAHLTTLREAEYVVKDGDVYHLSLKFLALGDYVGNRREAYRIADSYTEQLAGETECRAVFVVEENGRGVYLHTYSGKHAVWKYSTIGKRFHLHQTASGKALLSQLPEFRVREIAEKWGLPSRTDNTINDLEALLDELAEIRERGIAFNEEEQLDGVKAVGVPVQGADGQVVGAFSVASPANRVDEERFRTELPNILLGVANEFELEISLS
ncbi:IclR family transcriptional regulator [Haloarchaeobius amylolyticus]|uniref:IclR family transcriptional regulator n=1 Tax=Haloarchaeobius amylolyticus TaxID=1198296 RepID=UPI00226FF3D2|nr:IclR family transcriptional regulator [Haloarchaeobius amylolyticus]